MSEVKKVETPVVTIAEKAKGVTEEKTISNPFVGSITYADLLKEIPEETSLKDHYKDVLSDDEIYVLESEIKYYKKSLVKPKEAKEEKLTPKQEK